MDINHQCFGCSGAPSFMGCSCAGSSGFCKTEIMQQSASVCCILLPTHLWKQPPCLGTIGFGGQVFRLPKTNGTWLSVPKGNYNRQCLVWNAVPRVFDACPLLWEYRTSARIGNNRSEACVDLFLSWRFRLLRINFAKEGNKSNLLEDQALASFNPSKIEQHLRWF